MSRQFNTPILFLIFNRPDTTQKVFDRIRQLQPAFLFVAADGPREHVEGEKQSTEITRNIIGQVDWKCEVKTLFRDKNLGCKNSISSAITWFFENVEQGIVLEDDCLPDLSFFRFCEELLEKYKYDNKVSFIGGNYYQRQSSSEWGTSYYFSKCVHIWGWATWKRVWDKYDVDMKDYDSGKFEKEFGDIFNSQVEKKHWLGVFDYTRSKRLNAWSYQLTYTIWKNHGITIIPTKNLVVNVGFQNSSTHFFLEDSYRTRVDCEEMEFPLSHPGSMEVNRKADTFTFKNLYSHSFARGIRLIRENSPKTLFRYFMDRIKSK